MPTSALAKLPATFTYNEARAAGRSNRRIYVLRDAGEIEPLGRGLFGRTVDELVDLDLTEVLARIAGRRCAQICPYALGGYGQFVPDPSAPKPHCAPLLMSAAVL